MLKRKSEGKIKTKGRSSSRKDKKERKPIKEKLSKLSDSSLIDSLLQLPKNASISHTNNTSKSFKVVHQERLTTRGRRMVPVWFKYEY